MDDFMKRVGRGLEDLAGQASRQAEILRLQARMGSLGDDLDRILIEAGKRARELVRAQQLHDEELQRILEGADAVEDEMMAARQQVNDLRQGASPQAADEPDSAGNPPS